MLCPLTIVSTCVSDCESTVDLPLYFPPPLILEPIKDTVTFFTAPIRTQSTAAVDKPNEPLAKEIIQINENEEKKRFLQITNPDKFLRIDEIAQFFRELGYTPTNESLIELSTMTVEKITYEAALAWADKNWNQKDTVDFLSPVFVNYDTYGSATLKREQIKNILTQMGDALTVEEFDAIFKYLGFQENEEEIVYNNFVNKYCSRFDAHILC